MTKETLSFIKYLDHRTSVPSRKGSTTFSMCVDDDDSKSPESMQLELIDKILNLDIVEADVASKVKAKTAMGTDYTQFLELFVSMDTIGDYKHMLAIATKALEDK